jgi:UTP--glucose-1-phosphate uridylyltransferase
MLVKKGVIPAAGLCTRLRPLTLKMPKELFPLGKKLVIDYAMQEAMQSGIEEVCIVTSPSKMQIKEHFEWAFTQLLKEMGKAIDSVTITFVEQQRPLGLGDALWTAREFVGDQPFAVLLPDNVFVAKTPPIGQLMKLFSKRPTCCVGIMTVPENQAIFFNTARKLVYEESPKNVYKILEILDDDPKLVREGEIRSIGRYILTPRFFDYCPQARETVRKELRETDVLKEYLRSDNQLFGRLLKGERFDTGSVEGYSKAFVEFIDRDL